MRAILGLRKNIRCGTIIFLTFMTPQKECSHEVSRSVWTHDKIILACSGVFCSRKNAPGLQTTIHECASVCERILYILCAAFLVFHAEINTLRSGAFLLEEKTSLDFKSLFMNVHQFVKGSFTFVVPPFLYSMPN